jgi:hypothetical protein
MEKLDAGWPISVAMACSHSARFVAMPVPALSRQYEKFLFGQSRKFLLTAGRLEGWNESR